MYYIIDIQYILKYYVFKHISTVISTEKIVLTLNQI